MRVALFTHSLASDWNHGNAHFLRGVAVELIARGHEVRAFEPHDAWSRRNLVASEGEAALDGFRRAYPALQPIRYRLDALDLDAALDGIDLVLVHEWNHPRLVARLGVHRARARRYALLFHDTHHRSVSDPAAMAAFDLRHYDGALVFGRVIRDLYLRAGWVERAWVWHEAADVRVFRPLDAGEDEPRGDLVWIGNWGDGERTRELEEFLLEPARALGLTATAYGVRYPASARAALRAAGIRYDGWLPNFAAPAAFARHRVTVHVPRRYYARALAGIPTIRPFEALACGIPLVSAPWDDCERLFTPGRDFLVAADGAEMKRHLRALLADEAWARALAEHGRATILARHTCGHRVGELLDVARELGVPLRASLSVVPDRPAAGGGG